MPSSLSFDFQQCVDPHLLDGWLPGCHVSHVSHVQWPPRLQLVDSKLYPSLCLPHIAFQANNKIEKLKSHLHQPYPYSQLLAETIIEAGEKCRLVWVLTFNMAPPPAGWLTPGCHVSHVSHVQWPPRLQLVDSLYPSLCLPHIAFQANKKSRNSNPIYISHILIASC